MPEALARHRRRVLPLLAVLVALTAGQLAATSPQARAAGVLLSQGKPTTASSTENAGTAASAATDGNTGTRWSSAFTDPQWLSVDLGATAALDRVVLTWEAAHATTFQLQTSADGVTWTTIHTTTNGAGGTQDIPVTGTGRHVRLFGTARATGYGYSLW